MENEIRLVDAVEKVHRLGTAIDEIRLLRREWLQAELHAAIAGLDRVLAAPRTSKQVAFVFLSPGMVYSENTVVLTFDSFGPFARVE